MRLRRRLAEIEHPRIVVVPENDEAGFSREIADSDMLLHVLKPVTRGMMAEAKRLRLIQKIGVGVNTIDLEAARQAGIAVANMPGTNTAAVVEHTLALMLATLRRVAELDAATRAGRGWALPPEGAEAMGEIGGSVVGLVGYGAVARRLTGVLTVLGARVQYWSRSVHPDAAAGHVPFEQLLATSNMLSLHVPLTEQTRNLIDAAAIGRMKQGAILINTARGELVDQRALADALLRGALAGAGLDVFEREPLTEPGALASLRNVVMTPHVAWLTPQTIERSIAVIVENARRLDDGREVMNRVV